MGTTVPQAAVGQVFTSESVNAWCMPLATIKPEATDRIATPRYLDPDLQIDVPASYGTYEFRMLMIYSGPVGCTFKWWLQTPGGTSWWNAASVYRHYTTGSATMAHIASSDAAAQYYAYTAGTGTRQVVTVHGFLRMRGSSTRPFALKWGQLVQNDSPLSLTDGSFIYMRRIAA